MNELFPVRQSRDWRKICAGCKGGCCGCYPLPSELFERFGDRLQVPTDLTMHGDGYYTMPMTPDGLCPFLSRHDGLCVVYAERPPACRWFGEISELQCPRVNPHAAQLSFGSLLGRVARRLGVRLE